MISHPDNVHEVVPKHKSLDLDRVEPLPNVDPEIWKPIIPDLLEWTCDPTRPSTQVVISLLVSATVTVEAAIPRVSGILRKKGSPGEGPQKEGDYEHQNVLLHHFVSVIGIPFQRQMLGVLKDFEGLSRRSH